MGVCSAKPQIRAKPKHSPDIRKLSWQKDICSVYRTDSYYELNENDISDEYSITTHRLGEGSFASVFKSAKLKDERRKFAIKQVDKDLELSEVTIKREIEIWSGLDHPFIARFYEAFSSEKSFMLVLEYCAGGDLVSKVSKLERFTESAASMLTFNIIKAVSYLHEHGISHRDIKPDNFLFKTQGNDDQSDIKLVDFGLSKKFFPNQLKTMVGTAFYVAPEIFEGPYTYIVDNWAIGATVYVLLCGKPPFLGANNKEILDAAVRNEIGLNQPVWSSLSAEARDFISRLLKVDPISRMGLSEAMNHPWLKRPKLQVHEVAKSVITKGFKNRILEYFCLNDLQKVVLLLWARSTLATTQRNDLNYLFLALDKEHQGIISVEHLDSWLAEAGEGFSESELDQFCRHVDTFFNGIIRYSYFLSMSADKDSLFNNDDSLHILFDLLAEEQSCKEASLSVINRSIAKLNHVGSFAAICNDAVKQLGSRDSVVSYLAFESQIKLARK